MQSVLGRPGVWASGRPFFVSAKIAQIARLGIHSFGSPLMPIPRAAAPARGGRARLVAAAAAESNLLMAQLEAVESAFLIVVGILALGLMLLARARRRDRHDRDELRAHIRRIAGPSDPSM